MNSSLKNLQDITDYCFKNPNYCRQNRYVLCKKILKENEYKVENMFNRKFNNSYCSILKQIHEIIKRNNNDLNGDVKFGDYRNHKKKYDENKDNKNNDNKNNDNINKDKKERDEKKKIVVNYCNNNVECDDKLRKFLRMNGFNIEEEEDVKKKLETQRNIFFDFSPRNNDKSTVKMYRGGGLRKPKIKTKTKTKIKTKTKTKLGK